MFSFAVLMLQSLNAQNTLDFDGTDDRVDCGNDTSIQISGKALTLEAWIYPTAWKTNVYDGNVINKEYNTSNYGFMLRVGAGGKLNFAIGDGTWRELTTAGTILSLNTWQHIAGTYDGVKMRLYVNGAPVDSLPMTISIANASSTPMLIGGHTTYTRYYQGMIDEVRVWNKCLSESQLYSGMTDEICAKTPGLRAYYKFNQGKPSQNNPNVKKLNDLSGFYNHGTLAGFTLNGSSSNWIKGQNYKKAAVYAYDTATACDRYTGPSRKYTWTKTGDYNDTVPTVVMGCDSVIMIHLTIRKSTQQTINAFACNSYLSPGGTQTWTKSGVYTEKLKNKANCDSTVTVLLKIGGSRDTVIKAVCKSYTGPGGKRVYTSSGIYSDTLKGYGGCDSILVTKLTIFQQSFTGVTARVCNAYQSPSGKYTYTQNGTYSDTLVNFRGCDSIVTIQVEILRSTDTLITTACDRYVSPGGKKVWKQSGRYSDTVVNSLGCDSIIIVQLTVVNSSMASVSPYACSRYVSPSKKYTWTVSGSFKDTIPNAAGCDSVISINLQVANVNTAVVQNNETLTAQTLTGVCQWLDCNKSMAVIPGETGKVFKAEAKGDYAVAVTEAGCTDTSVCYNVSKFSGLDGMLKTGFSVMPNPSQGDFDLLLPFECRNAVVKITDLTGKTVFMSEFDVLQRVKLQTGQTPGLYVVMVEAENYRSQLFIVIER